ncbi:hypothetical protein ACJ73_06514 [Blastomyces percursus]|uniref:Uncharacterized protein n=1 Tax=Blastomyces percursus TaxID=1658174 RepID=A0A1J9R3F7_9EURO|nr:hypothetical protein ACJ73_06514 [Blastomyces percursus]
MAEAPLPRDGWTEMSFHLIHLEIARTSSKLETTISQPRKKVIIRVSVLRQAHRSGHVPSETNSSFLPLTLSIPQAALNETHTLEHGDGFSRDTYNHAWKVVEDAFNRWTDEDKNSKNGEILCRLMDRAKVATEQTVSRPSSMDALQIGYRPSQRNDMTATAIGPSHNEMAPFIDNMPPLLHANCLGYETPSSSSTDTIPLDIEGNSAIHTADRHELWDRDISQFGTSL